MESQQITQPNRQIRSPHGSPGSKAPKVRSMPWRILGPKETQFPRRIRYRAQHCRHHQSLIIQSSCLVSIGAGTGMLLSYCYATTSVIAFFFPLVFHSGKTFPLCFCYFISRSLTHLVYARESCECSKQHSCFLLYTSLFIIIYRSTIPNMVLAMNFCLKSLGSPSQQYAVY